MKIIRLSITLILVVNCLSIFGQTYMNINSISVSPVNPVTTDVVQLTTSGYLSSTNISVSSANFTIAGTNIYVNFVLAVGGMGLPVTVPYNQTFTLGQLAAGTYHVFIQGQWVQDSALPAQHFFTVTQSSTGQCTADYDYYYQIDSIMPLSFINIHFFDVSVSPSSAITSWNWNFGDGQTSTLQNPVHTFSSLVASYNVCLTIVTSSGCTNTYCQNIPTGNLPDCFADFSYSYISTITVFNVDFTDLSSGTPTGWLWDFGDSTTSVLQNPGHIYQTAGTYTVCLTIYNDSSCTNTYCQDITVSSQLPTCDASFSFQLDTTSILPMNAYEYYYTDLSVSNSTISSWTWNFGDGNTSSSQNPSHIYYTLNMEPYIVCLAITTSNGCSDNFCDTLFPGNNSVFCDAQFSFYLDTLVNCINCFQFTDQSISSGSITAWLWDFGDGQTDTIQNPSHSYNSSGSYTICLTITTSENCTSSVCASLVIPNPCILSITAVVSGVTTTGGSDGDIYIIVNDGISPYMFIWNTGATTQNLINIPAGNYSVTITDNQGCMVTGSMLVNGPSQYITQNINIASGWSIISTFIAPPQPDIEDVFALVINHIIIVKDGSGNIFWLQYTINTIGNIVLGKGYQVKTNASFVLSVTGAPAVPENTPVIINNGWSIIGYLRQNQAMIASMLSGIINNVVIVKNGSGLVYWPFFNLNNMIYMNPGEGYQINVTGATILTYPAN